jgi:hypothetical protein
MHIAEKQVQTCSPDLASVSSEINKELIRPAESGNGRHRVNLKKP